MCIIFLKPLFYGEDLKTIPNVTLKTNYLSVYDENDTYNCIDKSLNVLNRTNIIIVCTFHSIP